MKRHFTKTQKTIFAIIVIIAFIAVLLYYGIMIYRLFEKEKFVNQAIQISDTNQDPVFRLREIRIFSSANAIDNTEEKSLKDLDISQFTDISIFIDNTSYIQDLTAENTIKSIKIDNIHLISDQPTGIKSLTYKDPNDLGKFTISDAANLYTSIDTDTQCAPIEYTAVYKNEENTDYSKPTFYTDCSNPITLSYLNRNVVSHYALPDNDNISFNGLLLKHAKVDLVALNTTISFNVNITNNLNENFVYNVKINLSFDENSEIVTNGYSFQGRESSDSKAYNFFKNI